MEQHTPSLVPNPPVAEVVLGVPFAALTDFANEHPVQHGSWDQRLDDLLNIRGMEDDWDGLGAPAPSTALVDSALQLAQLLREGKAPPPCRIVAGLMGTVLFEWQQIGTYCELEVISPHHAEWTLSQSCPRP